MKIMRLVYSLVYVQNYRMARRKISADTEHIEIEVHGMSSEGVSVGRADGVVYFVQGALPGENVTARIRRRHRRYVEAEAVLLHSTSPVRVQPPCEHFGVCGGCSWQHCNYDEQVRWKHQQVQDALQRIGGFHEVQYRVPIGSEHQYGYRNKMEFSFSSSAWLTTTEIESGREFDRSFALGLHVKGRFDKVRNISQCLIQGSTANTLLSAVHSIPGLRSVPAYNQRSHEGFLRHLTIRTSRASGAVLGILTTTTPQGDEEQRIVDEFLGLLHLLPPDSGLLHTINDTRSPVATGIITATAGRPFLEENVLGITYRISPFSFFQTNSRQTEVLVQAALDAAGITTQDVVWDLYCGTGSISLPAARQGRSVIGLELVESAVADARQNAVLNKITNAEFYALDLHSKGALASIAQYPKPDTLIVDPPRSGMHPQIVEHISAIRPPRVSYVSCNPATLARDLAMLQPLYSIEWVQTIDMFPQTSHVEAVACLRLAD